MYEDEVDLRRSGSYLNSSFHSAWSEHSVDPDDFRVNTVVPTERCYHFAVGHNAHNMEEIPKATFKKRKNNYPLILIMFICRFNKQMVNML